jgi:FkbM family methyltransferase
VKLFGWVKPEYVFQPGQLLTRVSSAPTASEFAHVVLPWGLPIRVRPNEAHGRALCRLGIYDLTVTETLWRLIGRGEVVVDVGANIGYMTAVMVGRPDSSGTVMCFEPHPHVFEELMYNVAMWQRLVPGASLQCFQFGASDRAGTAILSEPPGFEQNRGLARTDSRPSEKLKSYEIATRALDEVLGDVEVIHVLKLDVEGHEAKVLAGARRLLEDHRVRDVVFEEHKKYPTESTHLVEACGYRVYRLQKTFLGPRALPAQSERPPSSWEPSSFLATTAPERALRLLNARGWSAMRRRALRPDASEMRVEEVDTVVDRKRQRRHV